VREELWYTERQYTFIVNAIEFVFYLFTIILLYGYKGKLKEGSDILSKAFIGLIVPLAMRPVTAFFIYSNPDKIWMFAVQVISYKVTLFVLLFIMLSMKKLDLNIDIDGIGD